MAAKVMIVTGKLVEREELSDMLSDRCETVLVADGGEAKKLLMESGDGYECVFLRADLPGVSGEEILKASFDKGLTRKIPFIAIEGEDDPDTPDSWFDMGIMDVVRRPFRTKTIRRRVDVLTRIAKKQEKSHERLGSQDETLRKQFKILQLQSEELKKKSTSLMEALGSIVEYRNLDYSNHIQRVKEFTRILGLQMMKDYPDLGLNEEKVEIFATASMLHDIGKICLPDNIILKPGRLTPEELEIMRSHTSKGCELLEGIKNTIGKEYYAAAFEICKFHHERYDGKGYPEEIKGDKIPVSAQIVGLADVYDGLVTERLYKKAVSTDRAFEMIVDGDCGVFSPKLMDSFRKCRKAFETLVDQTGLELADREKK